MLDRGEPRLSCLMSKCLDHLDHQEQHGDLYKFIAITGHQEPISPQDKNYKGTKYNVMVEWKTGKITEEQLSLKMILLHVLYMPRNMTSLTWMAGKGSNTLLRTKSS